MERGQSVDYVMAQEALDVVLVTLVPLLKLGGDKSVKNLVFSQHPLDTDILLMCGLAPLVGLLNHHLGAL